MAAYNPGDLKVYTLNIAGIEFAQSFISFDVYESIRTPGIVANFVILDTENYIFQNKIAGGEDVELVFSSPGGEIIDYKFKINSIKEISSSPNLRAKTYQVECVSEEALNAKDRYVSKVYPNNLYSDMVEDVFKTFIRSTKNLEIEPTKTPQKYVIPKLKPFEAIDNLRRRSVSPTNDSSSYVFFENKDGFHFVTIEKLFRDHNIIKTLVQDAATGANFLAVKGNAILAAVIPQMMNSARTINMGNMKQSFRTFNFQTNEYKQKDVDNPADNAAAGGENPVSQTLKGDHTDEPNVISVMGINNQDLIGLKNRSFIPEQSPAQIAYADRIGSSSIKLSTVGDSTLKAGAMVTANLLRNTDETTYPGLDPRISGDFLIFNIRHQVKSPGKRPRYTCELELVKGGYEESI